MIINGNKNEKENITDNHPNQLISYIMIFISKNIEGDYERRVINHQETKECQERDYTKE